MIVQCKTVLYPVTDVAATRALFVALLGAEPHVDSPYYVGFNVDGSEIGLVPGGHDQGLRGPVAFYDVADIHATLATLSAGGATVTQEPTDVGGGMLVGKVDDADGNSIGVRQIPTDA